MRPIELTWPGGHHAFALPIGPLRALQDARDSGPEEILNRFRTGTWHVDDVIQTLRWGLVGGGMDAAEAATKVTPLIDLHPLALFKLTAQAVLMHAMIGPEDDPVGKPGGATKAPENGASRSSTETAP